MLSDATLDFNRDVNVYFTGEEVSGMCIMYVPVPTVVRYVKISWKGLARTSFHKKNIKYYLKNYTMAWQATEGNNKLPAGYRGFRFSFRIPTDCPPSVVGTFGSIQYKVKVELVRPWWPIEKMEQTFVVKQSKTKIPIDSRMLQACHFQNYRNSGAIFSDGLISMKVNLRKRVFVPGDKLVATVELRNNTNKKIASIHSELVAQCHYHSRPHGFQCSMENAKYCPLPKKHRRNDEATVDEKTIDVNLPPYQSTVVDVEMQLAKRWMPTFTSDMLSNGYLWCFSTKSSSFTGNQLHCNARIRVVPRRTLEAVGSKSKNVRQVLPLEPPPYSPRRL